MFLIEYEIDYTKIIPIFALVLALSNYNIFEDIICNSFYKRKIMVNHILELNQYKNCKII